VSEGCAFELSGVFELKLVGREWRLEVSSEGGKREDKRGDVEVALSLRRDPSKYAIFSATLPCFDSEDDDLDNLGAKEESKDKL
jgi:hypothetical protein